MSKDDIIKNWKGSDKPSKNVDNPPANPVGDAEMPDKDLESVSGGSMSTESALTYGCCTTPFCPTGKLNGCPNGEGALEGSTFD